MYFFPKSVSNLPRGVLAIKPIWIRYGSTTNSNIEESSPNPAAVSYTHLTLPTTVDV